MILDKQTFKEYLEASEPDEIVGLGFQPEHYGVTAVWLTSQGYTDVLVMRDDIIYRSRETAGRFLTAAPLPDWLAMWIVWEDVYFFSREVNAQTAIELLDKLPV